MRLSPALRPSSRVVFASSRVSSRNDCALPSKPPMSAAAWSSATSPLCPNGGWPRSCARQAVSTRSGSQPSAAPSSRPTCAHSSECVSRVRGKSLSTSAGPDDLGLRAEPTQRRAMDDAGAVAFEGGPARPLGRLADPARAARSRRSAPRIRSRCRRYPGPSTSGLVVLGQANRGEAAQRASPGALVARLGGQVGRVLCRSVDAGRQLLGHPNSEPAELIDLVGVVRQQRDVSAPRAESIWAATV